MEKLKNGQKISPQLAPWLFADDVQSLLAILSQGRGMARIVGGAVRNTFLNEPVEDIDIATTWTPQEVMRLAKEAGFHTVPTGIDFGTVTVIVNHRPFEVTSLRSDLTNDGRHAVVAFGQDWQEDAQRRDFTINALYCDAQGVIYDEVGGLDDIWAGHIRFIGKASARIEEDYLRILRFFRFFAYYGKGRPDREALRSIVRHKEGVARLSAERIWGEVKKILSAPRPHRALLWMRQSGVLSIILPESEKWGIDLIPGLLKAERICDFSADPLLRLMSIIPPEEMKIEKLTHRLKLSGIEKRRLITWAKIGDIPPDMNMRDLRKILYLNGAPAVVDKIKIALSTYAPVTHLFKNYHNLLRQIGSWQPPLFPLHGRDLMMQGYKSGPELGKILKKLEKDWIESDFCLTKAQLLATIS